MKIEKHTENTKMQNKINHILHNHQSYFIASPATPIKTITYLATFSFFATLKQVFLTSKLTPARMQEKALTEHEVTMVLSERHQPQRLLKLFTGTWKKPSKRSERHQP